MESSPSVHWHDVVIAARAGDWSAAGASLGAATPIAISRLAHDDYVRPAALAVALHAPRSIAELLRVRLRGARGTVPVSADWARHLVEGMSYTLAAEIAVALDRPRWPELTVLFRRLVSIPRLVSAQDGTVERIARVLLAAAREAEARIAPAILANDDLALLHRTADPRVRRVPGSFRLSLIADCFGSLCASPHYPHIARELLFEALSLLHWPTLRLCGWMSYTPIPGGSDARWDSLLTRTVVRAVSRPPDDEPEFD